MINLSLFSVNSMGVRYGASKLFQILIPLVGYLLIRDLLVERLLLRPAIRDRLLQLLPEGPRWQAIRANLPTLFEQAIGFTAWKIGCDLGFFLIVTGLGPWQRAFTWSGLIPYTIIQYFFYYLLGRRMLIEGRLNPFSSKSVTTPVSKRPPNWQRLASKYLHEDLNATSEDIPLRQVFLKPFVDYAGLVLSWSMYTVGIFFAQSREFNLAPLIHFGFYPMFTFYLVNTYGYIIGFNIGEWIHFRLSWLEEKYSAWARYQATTLTTQEQSVNASQQVYLLLKSLQNYWLELKYRVLWRFTPVTERYGLNRRWLLSAIGGVYCVVLVAPGWSGWLLNVGTQASRAWFSAFGSLDQVQLAQISESPTQTAQLPDSNDVITGFPAFWQAMYKPDEIASNPPEILQKYGIDINTNLASQAVLKKPDQAGT